MEGEERESRSPAIIRSLVAESPGGAAGAAGCSLSHGIGRSIGRIGRIARTGEEAESQDREDRSAGCRLLLSDSRIIYHADPRLPASPANPSDPLSTPPILPSSRSSTLQQQDSRTNPTAGFVACCCPSLSLSRSLVPRPAPRDSPAHVTSLALHARPIPDESSLRS